jgi:L-amino acid N-acyltransferase YncA
MLEIRALEPSDFPDVARIFADGITTRNATFETQPPSWEQFDSEHLPDHRLVALADGRVVGWIALSPVSSRECYRGVVEDSVYVAENARGRGVGRSLLEALISSAESAGIWTIQAAMFPENEASVELHLAVGFRLVGRLERIAQLDGVWRDTVLLERRSSVAG